VSRALTDNSKNLSVEDERLMYIAPEILKRLTMTRKVENMILNVKFIVLVSFSGKLPNVKFHIMISQTLQIFVKK
jgi:hypothetical protein